MEEKTTLKKVTESDLRGFNGTDCYYKEFLNLRITEGVKFVRDNLKCDWLITDIASIYNFEDKVLKARTEGEEFFIIDLIINPKENKAVLKVARDKDKTEYINLYYSQKYEFTDIKDYFEGLELNFYLINNVLLLRGEY
jgi:hypothetical protein